MAEKGRQRVVLASSSPRRAELLRLVVPDFTVVPPETAEKEIRRPWDLVRNARAKAREVAGRHPGIVIGADTGVFRKGKHFGKPRDLEEAAAMLRALSGGWHWVYTALWVVCPAGERWDLVGTAVRFAPLSHEEIRWYLAREEVLDKAGAYAIQGAAALFVEEIRGDFFNVVGLPLRALYRLLRGCGLDLALEEGGC